jgi:hypothetical protein
MICLRMKGMLVLLFQIIEIIIEILELMTTTITVETCLNQLQMYLPTQGLSIL